MADLTTKTVKVPSSKAEEWNTYVEENPEVDSISHLIRLSVEREMQGRYDQPQTVPDDTDDAVSGEVLTTLRQIQTGLSDLEDRMSAIESVGQAEASYDLKKAVYQVLPSDDELQSPIATVSEIPEPENPDDLGVMTARDVAQAIGADVAEVEDTLDELAETTGQVQRSDTNHGGNHYWKRGQ
jgi:hypothetical protein